jgi:putative ABC transport system ATP-binding protein
VIEIRSLTKTYGDSAQQVHALEGIDAVIDKGELVSLVGPSGSGKTSLLNILGCLDRPSSGTVSVNGVDLFGMSDAELTKFRAASLGFIFQTFNLFDLLTARENVEYPLHLNGVGKGERITRADEALRRVELGDKLHRRPDQLSGGEKQRVAIARALVHHPELVLADEPTANLDSKTGATIIELLVRLNQELGATFVVATHDPALMASAPRCLHLQDGKLGVGS